MTKQTPEQIINVHRAEEINILARIQMRARDNVKDENRLLEIGGILAVANALIPAPEDEPLKIDPTEDDDLINEEETRPA